jgi:N-acyl-D-aspartate/D-glutamate deacylase
MPEGQFVTPGIIDTHTHYDAQPFWDKLCTSSIWHGVTTVLMGNCGLTLAPLRPEHRDAMLATFCCVEDIPVRSLASVVPWNWQNFDEYLNAIDIGLGLNLMPLVGHNPLRLSAMDQAAWDRAATAGRDRAHAAVAPRIARGRRVGLEHDGFADPRRAAGPARADATRRR